MPDNKKTTPTPGFLESTKLTPPPDSQKYLIPDQPVSTTETFCLKKSGWKLAEARIIGLMQNRRSLRTFADKPLSLSDLSFLLWTTQGVTARRGDQFLRTSPSAGATYPIETYLLINRVMELKNGIYHFNIRDFSLELIGANIPKEQVQHTFLQQKFLLESAVIFIWSGVSARTTQRYDERGLRYIFLDAGHLCQNLLLGAEAIGCGGCPVASFYDDELNTLLGLDGSRESALYAAAIGKKNMA